MTEQLVTNNLYQKDTTDKRDTCLVAVFKTTIFCSVTLIVFILLYGQKFEFLHIQKILT